MMNTIVWDGKQLEQMIADSLPENDDDQHVQEQLAMRERLQETIKVSTIPELDEDTYLDQTRGFM